jgi:hypothetical protein
MPVIKCSNGKYRIGTGACIYDTYEKASEVWSAIQYGLLPKTELEIEPNPCWEGYEPIGLKPDGSPNCVPIALSEQFADESYADYGDGVKGNAKRGRELNEKNGNKCATQVGKVRSAQLESGEAISLKTLKRMYSYLSRAETYYDENDSNACGTISFLLWGGKAGLSWSRNKLRELGLIELAGGMAHYTKDGKLWEGETHKDSEGKLMTGKVHSEDSQYLYHKEELK